MALAPGTRVGVYEVMSLLGAGGMGEVYRAHDTKLGRDVALKIVAESFTNDGERTARFHREAQLLASLNHPHIATIHGLEEVQGVQFLVMELVEGDTLAARLAAGPLRVSEALTIARQVGDALSAAHEKGIIHRDLKPANIALTAEGQVKVLDFGLAKALETGPSPDMSISPTLSVGATQAGVILGTAAYMAPEQARGKAVDKRSDIWAFGCVLYEMLTGKRAFEGEDISDTLANVMKIDPDWRTLPLDVPPAIRILLRRCLERDRRQRLSDIGAALVLIDEAPALAASAHDEASVQRERETIRRDAARDAVRSMRRRVALIGTLALVIGSVIAGGAVWLSLRRSPLGVVRTDVTPSGTALLTIQGNDRDVAITPDGSKIVYRGTNQLLVRSLDQLEPRALNGLGLPRGIFVSPDGQWIGFFDGQTALKKVAITGGPAVSLCPVSGNPRGATWGDDGTVIFATTDPNTGLLRVPAAGGDSTVLTKPDREHGEIDHLWPEMLPGGEAVLFTITSGDGLDNAQIAVLDLRTHTQKVVVRGGSHAQYVSTGHLVYGTGGTLRAVGFDLARLEAVGTPVPVLDQVAITTPGSVEAAVATNGTLVYLAGNLATSRPPSTLVWVGRNGTPTPVFDREAIYRAPRISPDGARVAVSVLGQDGNEDIWVVDSKRGTQTRLTSEKGADTLPLWTPDGMRIAFSSARGGLANALYWMAADGSGAAEALTKTTSNQGATSWFPDGSLLAFYDVGGTYDIFTLKPGAAPVRFMETAFQEQGPVFSPDGRWIAYSSNDTGRAEIYVAPYPGPGGKIAISTTGGRSPRWSADGKELFYRNGAQMMGVAVTPGATLSVGSPRLLFTGDYLQEDPVQGAHNYDVAHDGQRFVMMKATSQVERAETRPKIVLVQNWTEELKARAPIR